MQKCRTSFAYPMNDAKYVFALSIDPPKKITRTNLSYLRVAAQLTVLVDNRMNTKPTSEWCNGQRVEFQKGCFRKG